MTKKIIVITSWIAVILWMGLIFYLSAQVVDKSNNLSGSITKVIIKTVQNVTIISDKSCKFNLYKWNHYIRKFSHFFEYLVLGVLFANAVMQSFVKNSLIRNVAIVLVFCIVYSISDELHQLFVAGRGPAIRDVVLDSLGSCVGIFLYIGIYSLHKRYLKLL